MAQASDEIINLLSLDYLTAKIKTILEAIEREKLIGDTNYSFEGQTYGKSTSSTSK